MPVVSFLLELVGAALVVFGVAQWSVPAAFALAGVFFLVAGLLSEPDA